MIGLGGCVMRLCSTQHKVGSLTPRRWCMIAWVAFFTVPVCILWVPGCGPVPDVQPFAEKTRILEEQYEIATRGVAAEVILLDKVRGQEFDRELSKRARLLTAVRQYAEELVSLAQVAQAGSSGANQLSGAVESLARQFEQTLPTPYVGIAQEVLDIVENVHAQRSLAEAIETADPAVQELALLFAKEMKPLREFTQQSYALARMQAKKEKQEYLKLIDEYRLAMNTRTALSVELQKMQAQLADPNMSNEELETKLSRLQTRVILVDNWIKEIQSRPEWEDYQEKMQSLNTRYTALLRIMSEIEVAMETWSITHKQLADVVRTGRQADVDLLAHHIANLNRLISEVRNQ